MFVRSVYSSRLVGVRYFSTSRAALAQALVYHGFGNPSTVLSLENTKYSAQADQVHVKMLAAPINPADINMIQGTYGITPSLPAIGGNEGVGVVENPGNSSFRKGDWVIPATSGFGTWRTEAFVDASDLITIPNNLPVEYAATISVNPCTAYRMLSDFVDLKSGDVIIQNGANSGVGSCVAQIAKSRGIRVINVVRSRETGMDQFLSKLKNLGYENIITEEQLGNKVEFEKLTKNLGEPKLALNCVGGKSATDLARTLGKNGIMVTYGGMSRKPILLPTGVLIFKNLTFRGFWMSEWTTKHSQEDRVKMLNEITELINKKKLNLSFNTMPLQNYQDALQLATSEHKDCKVILKLN